MPAHAFQTTQTQHPPGLPSYLSKIRQSQSPFHPLICTFPRFPLNGTGALHIPLFRRGLNYSAAPPALRAEIQAYGT
jgi:hypothetical protein